MEDKIRKAEAYKQYYSDPVFREPWEQVRASFVARWQTTLPSEYEMRERIFQFLGLMDKLDTFVADTIASGEIEKTKLETLVANRNEPDVNPYH